MDIAFASLAFAEPARAAGNLKLLEHRLPASLWSSLPSLLAQVPDPDSALNYLERYLRPEETRPVDRALAHLTRHPAALHYLLMVFSYSRFLSETLVQKPDLIAWLYRPGHGSTALATGRHTLERVKSAEDLHEEYARFEATEYDQPAAVVLARFKRREYLRIMLRDVLRIASLSETTLELSRLADVLLDRARRISEQKLQNLYGTPQYADANGRLQTAQVTILSLGKLGAQELNYSSDIDLMFIYAHSGQTSGGSTGPISNAEYFVRLAQTILRLVTEPTPEGMLFRVDLRLRPQGGEGDLAVSLPAALEYYRGRAREWELQMLIKARCSSGDPETARQFLRELRPLIYRPEFNLAAAEAVLNARAGISRELRRPRGTGSRPADHGARWNVKLSPGGIRDIEFLTQCLQRLYGGAEPWLATPSTLLGLQRLHDKGFLSGHDFQRLASAYEFLRRVEHRLQLRDGLQRHTLPEGLAALNRLARRCGVDPAGGLSAGQELQRRIAHHFADVRGIYERTLQPRLAQAATRQATPSPARAPGEGALMRRLREEFPAVARAAADATAAGDSYARRGLHRFLSSAVLEQSVMRQMELHPFWVTAAADLFSRSDLLVEMLARNPEETAVVADPGLAGFRGPLVAASGDFAQAMAALRVAYRRGVLATLVRALASRNPIRGAGPFATFAILSRLVEEALAGAAHLAAREVFSEVDLADAPFAVIALGRLGTSEMDIGSDADLLFVVADSTSAEERQEWRRLAERFVHVVSSHTREGLLFPVDTRLRPRGGEGEMLQSVSYLREYFSKEAQGWEAATYLKARPVAGNLDLGAQAIAEVHRVFRERYRGPVASELARQLGHTRERLEKEGTTARAKGEFKKARGGYYDIEYVLAFLALTGCPDFAPPAPALHQVTVLQAAGSLEADAAKALRGAALLYRGIDHAVRIVTGRPTHRLPDSALAQRITSLLHDWGVPLEASLEETVTRARRQTRAIYESIVLAARN